MDPAKDGSHIAHREGFFFGLGGSELRRGAQRSRRAGSLHSGAMSLWLTKRDEKGAHTYSITLIVLVLVLIVVFWLLL